LLVCCEVLNYAVLFTCQVTPASPSKVAIVNTSVKEHLYRYLLVNIFVSADMKGIKLITKW